MVKVVESLKIRHSKQAILECIDNLDDINIYSLYS